MQQWWTKFRAVSTGRQTLTDDLTEEMQAHLQMEEESLRDRGMPPEAARAAARRRFGNTTQVAERSYDSWSFPALESLLRDVRHGFRAMLRAPAFSLVVILTFALGVGLNTAVFSVVNGVLLKPLPYPHSERLVRLGEANAKGDFSVSWANFQYWQADNRSFENMAAFENTGRTLTGRGDPIATRGMIVTAPFFSLLGIRPLLGRVFGPADDRPGAPAVVLLSHRFWAGQLGSDPHIVGSTLILNGTPFEVAGVAAPVWTPWRADYYLPFANSPDTSPHRGRHGSIRALALLKPGVTLASASTDLDAIMRHLAETDPGPEADHHSFGRFFTETTIGDVRQTLLVLMGAAVLILLIACANVASLLLARNTARAGELALRKAIGAGYFRLVRQLLTENLVVAGMGGIAGIAFAFWGLRLLISIAPTSIPRLAETTLDLPALLFACGITLAAGLLAGLAPVLAARRIDLAAALKDGPRSTGGGKRRQSLRNSLVVAEVAITFVLAFGSGLLLRSLLAAQKTDPGFDPHNVLTFSLSLPAKAYPGPQSVGNFYTSLTDGLRSLPGVAAVSAVNCPPPAGDCGDFFYSAVDRPMPPRDQVPISLFNSAAAGYFAMMRIPMRQGREFNDTDRANGANVTVINEKLARTWWPNESAVGHRIKAGGPYLEGDVLEIVGVAADVWQFGLDAEPMPEIYLPAARQNDSAMSLMIRTGGDPANVAAAVRSEVANLDRNLPLRGLGTLTEALGAGLARRRFSTLLLTVLACLAMLLAAVGIYGLLSYWVNSRVPEIAIRLALGARPSRILRWTGLHALRLAAAGVILGAGGAWASAHFLSGMVFGVQPHDGTTIVAAAAAVLTIAALATAFPSWRAARTDVARSLHRG